MEIIKIKVNNYTHLRPEIQLWLSLGDEFKSITEVSGEKNRIIREISSVVDLKSLTGDIINDDMI